VGFERLAQNRYTQKDYKEINAPELRYDSHSTPQKKLALDMCGTGLLQTFMDRGCK
jgi:hypothetical protein